MVLISVHSIYLRKFLHIYAYMLRKFYWSFWFFNFLIKNCLWYVSDKLSVPLLICHVRAKMEGRSLAVKVFLVILSTFLLFSMKSTSVWSACRFIAECQYFVHCFCIWLCKEGSGCLNVVYVEKPMTVDYQIYVVFRSYFYLPINLKCQRMFGCLG